MNPLDEPLERRLASMPSIPPPPDLWPRLALARQQRVNRFKTTIGTTAILLLCVALLPIAGDIGGRSAPAQLSIRPATSDTPGAALDADTLEQIRALDRALQTAYDEGATDDEIEPLWTARQSLLPRHAATSSSTTAGSGRS